MTTRRLMVASAITLGLIGLVAVFVPEELASILDLPVGSGLGLQLAGAGFLAIAVLNWIGRSAIYGGVYGRPIILANLTLGVVAAGSLTSAVTSGDLPRWVWVGVAGFVVQTLGFGRLLLTGVDQR